MNKTLLDFYTGTTSHPNGLFFNEILALSDLKLEISHDIIQWLFPLLEASQHNLNAPLLDQETIEAFRKNSVVQHNLLQAGMRFWDFLVEGNVDKPSWITPRNHNLLRITRIIKCYKLFDKRLASIFYVLAMYYYGKFPSIIGPKTFSFWEDAFKS